MWLAICPSACLVTHNEVRKKGADVTGPIPVFVCSDG
jgi:hypothetical protein